MNYLKTTAAALALSALSGTAMAATQGGLGAQSMGTLDVTMTVSAPTTDVEVLGLNDIVFGTVATSSATPTTVGPQSELFCIKQPTTATAANVDIKISQMGHANGSPFALKATSGTNSVPVSIGLFRPDGVNFVNPTTNMLNAVTTVFSTAACTSATQAVPNSAHRITVTPGTIPAGASGNTGVLTATFEVLVGPSSN